MICSTIALTLSLASLHLTHDYQSEYNEVNPGISIECDQYSAGYFKNSLSKDSYHAGFIFKKTVNSQITIGTNLGVVTGYQSDPVPFIRPFIQYENIRLGYIPRSTNFGSEEVITLEYSFTLD